MYVSFRICKEVRDSVKHHEDDMLREGKCHKWINLKLEIEECKSRGDTNIKVLLKSCTKSTTIEAS